MRHTDIFRGHDGARLEEVYRHLLFAFKTNANLKQKPQRNRKPLCAAASIPLDCASGAVVPICNP